MPLTGSESRIVSPLTYWGGEVSGSLHGPLAPLSARQRPFSTPTALQEIQPPKRAEIPPILPARCPGQMIAVGTGPLFCTWAGSDA